MIVTYKVIQRQYSTTIIIVYNEVLVKNRHEMCYLTADLYE